MGQVMGCTVDRAGWQGWGNCPGPTTSTAPRSTTWSGHGAYVEALKAIRHRALGRLVAEARLLGADGVVDVDVRLTSFPGVDHGVELQLMGTAVRARGRRHTREPFVAAMTAPEVAALLLRGWVPVGLAFGVAVEVRHHDVLRAARAYNDNVELVRGTELVRAARSHVRDDLQEDVARLGGQGVVVLPSTLELSERECGRYGGDDDIATASTFGTVIAPFRRRDAVPRTLTFVPLGPRRPDVRPPGAAAPVAHGPTVADRLLHGRQRHTAGYSATHLRSDT